MTEINKLNQIEQSNEAANENLEGSECNTESTVTLTQQISNSTKEKLEEIETKNIEKLYHVGLNRRNPNHGLVGYIDIVAARDATAHPKKHEWDYDYDVRLTIKVENESGNRVKLSCEDKSIVVDIGYYEWKPETIERKYINKILNVLGYEVPLFTYYWQQEMKLGR